MDINQQSTKNQDVHTNLDVHTQKDQIQEFRLKKIQNDKLAKLYEDLGQKKKASYLRNCSSTPTFYIDKTTKQKKLLFNFFCRQRMCPLCSWQRAKKTFGNIFSIITEPEFKDLEYIFITLTIKNCKSEDLQNNLDMMFSGWRKLTASKKAFFRKSFEGCFRALEITYNKKENTYHPHFHILVAVKKDYFKKTNKKYISQEKLILQWRKVCNLDYSPNVDVRKVKVKNKKVVAEVAKYTVKSADINDKEVLKTLDNALFRRRLISYHDLFKTVKAKLKLEDEEDIRESPENYKTIMADPEMIKILYKWNIGTKTYNLKRFIESENASIPNIINELDN